MDPTKVSAVIFCYIYIIRFIHGYSTVAALFPALTSSRVLFQWSPLAEKAFQNLKAMFTSAPILQVPDPDRQFVVKVDASNVGVGASYPSGLPMIRNSTPAPSFQGSFPRRVSMTLGTKSSGL